MLKTYLTTVSLQGPRDLGTAVYRREGDVPPVPTRFPVIQIIRDTLCEEDTAQIIVIRQENADTLRNYGYLLEELAELGITERQIRVVSLPDDQRPETLVALCRDVADALPQAARAYACITYGTKTIPVVTMAALTCAEATHTELEVGGLYYGEFNRAAPEQSNLCNVTVLYHLSGMVNSVRDRKTAEEVFRRLIWLSEYRED